MKNYGKFSGEKSDKTMIKEEESEEKNLFRLNMMEIFHKSWFDRSSLI